MDLKLTPRRPAGHASRKARGYALELRRLREEGFTFEAIREALEDAGIRVSERTVRRECARACAPTPTPPANAPLPPPSTDSSADVAMSMPPPGIPRGKGIAAEFMQTHQRQTLQPVTPNPSRRPS
jgi:hypothetical protein